MFGIQLGLSGTTLETFKDQQVLQVQRVLQVLLVLQVQLVLQVSLVILQLLLTLPHQAQIQAMHGSTATMEKLMFTLIHTGLRQALLLSDQQVQQDQLVRLQQ
jgi:hypothetical protein